MRPDNWPRLLDEYVEAVKRTPFAWGQLDCITYVCGWHRLMTGRDVYAPWRGKYDSEIGAARLIVATGCASRIELGDLLFGNAMPVARAGRGDIVCDGEAFGLHLGRAISYLGAERALTFVPAIGMRAAWRV